MKIQLLQSELHWLNPEANLNGFSEKIAELGTETDVIFLPEMFSTGFSMQLPQASLLTEEDVLRWMKENAQKCQAAITGSVAISENDRLYNRLLWVQPDHKIERYNKRHLFRMAGEEAVFKAGNERKIIEWKGIRWMPMVCYDLRFPVWSRNDLNYDVLFYVANWPKKRIAQWDRLLAARAIENQCYVIGLNRTGKDGNDVEYNGHSAVYNYLGERITNFEESEKNISADLDISALQQYRQQFPAWKDSDRFEIET